MKKKIKWAVIIILLGAISFGLYKFGNPSKPSLDAAAGMNDIAFQVSQETLINTIEVKGKSTYEQETIVYAPFTGKVQTWKVKDAQQVKKGESLFNLDPNQLAKEIVKNEAALKKMRLEEQLNEFQASIEDEASSSLGGGADTESDAKKQYMNREAAKLQRELNQMNLSIQEQELTEQRKKLNSTSYNAPASGIFLYDDPAKLPKYVEENTRIGKIVDTSKLQLVSYVGEQDIFTIKPGMPVNVKINALKDVPLKGKVEKVSKFAKARSAESENQPAQFEVVISLEANEQLIAGLSLTGQVETERKEGAIVVPTVAVMKDQLGAYVMKKGSDGLAARQDIEVGMETPEKTEVISGLKAGDTVVLQ